MISNNAESGALARVRAAAIPAHHLPSRTHRDPDALDLAVARTLADDASSSSCWRATMRKLALLVDVLARIARGEVSHP